MKPQRAVGTETRQRLLANRKQLEQIASAMEEEAGLHRPLAEAVGDVIARDFEDGDLAQAITERETSDTLIQLLGQNREQVERALERLREGKYGICEDCGQRIPSVRLQFQPAATRCVGCQGRWDRLNRRSA